MDILRFLPNNEYQAAINANAPTALNPFVTIADLAGLGNNIYNADGVLTGNRNVDLAGNDLTFDTGGGGKISISENPSGPPATRNMEIYVNTTEAVIAGLGTTTPGGTPVRIIGGVQPGSRGIVLETPINIIEWFHATNTQGLIHDASAISGSDKTATWRNLSGTVAYLSDIPAAPTTLYSGNSTIGAGRVATITDTLSFTGSGAPSATGLVSITNSTAAIATSRGLSITVNGANTTNEGINLSVSGATTNRSIVITSGEIFQSAEEVKNVFGYNVPSHLDGTVSVGANNNSTMDINFHSHNRGRTGTHYGFQYTTTTGSGGAGSTIYGVHSTVGTNLSTNVAGYFLGYGRTSAATAYGVQAEGRVPNDEVHTGTIYGVHSLVSVNNAAASGNILVATRSHANLNVNGSDTNYLYGHQIDLNVAAGAAVNNDAIGLDVNISNSGTVTGLFLAARFNKDIEVTGGTNGVILEDRTSGTRYRVYIDATGVLHTEAA
jgi:hypothetical protein